MRIRKRTAGAATGGVLAALAGLAVAWGFAFAPGADSRHGLLVEPALAFDGSATPATVELTPQDGLRAPAAAIESSEKNKEFTSGYLWKYAQQVGSARYGAVTHPGASVEKACYADT